ncbi:conserved hypothetical protein [Ricinus communis]|uniref:Uncharacterized protein n=1 Tax=Ricinus communis TaxID=3988 RepID=B9TIY8_RICCO|nr:conserved hypothetical protein [Ricinus communis]
MRAKAAFSRVCSKNAHALFAAGAPSCRKGCGAAAARQDQSRRGVTCACSWMPITLKNTATSWCSWPNCSTWPSDCMWAAQLSTEPAAAKSMRTSWVQSMNTGSPRLAPSCTGSSQVEASPSMVPASANRTASAVAAMPACRGASAPSVSTACVRHWQTGSTHEGGETS